MRPSLHEFITGEQIRAARALVRLEQAELARRTGLSLETIKRLERTRGRVEAHASTLRALRETFEGLGVRLIWRFDGAVGVGLAPPPGTARPAFAPAGV